MHLEAEINSIDAIGTSSVKTGSRQISYLATTDLNPDPRNPRLHTREQIRSIAKEH